MSGQGRPKTIVSAEANRADRAYVSSVTIRLTRALLCAVLAVGWVLVSTAWAVPPKVQSLTDVTTAEQTELRLRVSIGGGTARRWVGSISIDGAASFSNGLPRGLSADANAAIQVQPDIILMAHDVETNYNAVDVSLRGSSDANLKVDLAPFDQPGQRRVYSVRLRDIISEGDHRDIDETGNRCSIDRVPGDQLKLQIDRPHLIFRPGETIEFSVAGNRTSFASKNCQCRVAVTEARQTKNPLIPWAASVPMMCDQTGSSDSVPMRLKAPAGEGVYDLALELQPSGFSGGLARQAKLVRKVQFVVLADSVPTETVSMFKRESWKQYARFSAAELMDPSSVGWPNQLTSSITQLNPRNLNPRNLGRKGARQSYGNTRRQLINSIDGPALQFQPGGWQAIPISAPAGRGPCLIEVDCVVEGDAALGISLLQFDAAGQISAAGTDSGLISERPIVEKDLPSTQTYRLYHWPNESVAWLVLANRHARQVSKVLDVRVLTGPSRIPNPNESKVDSLAGTSLPTRGMMAFLESPTFPENFGASEYVDSSIGQSLDDWVTFYEGVDRLVQHLKARNLAGAFVTVAADGSGLYPSQSLQPNPLYDTGNFLALGNDPIRKDVVELMFRMFEREQLKLVPVLSLNGPLPGIDSIDEVKMVDHNGKTLPPQSGERLPRYNPLATVVQSAVEQVLEELVARYQHHDSFDGVAVTCEPDAVTLLPGEQWACDEVTMKRFFDSANLDDADRNKLRSRADRMRLVAGPQREAWLAWRAAQMSAFYQRLGAIVGNSLKDGTLYLAPVDLYRNVEIATSLNPALHSSSDYREAMLRMGFDSSWSSAGEENQTIVVLNPHRISPSDSLALQRVDIHVAALDQMNELFRNRKRPGDLFVHRSNWVHFAQLEQELPFQNQQNPLMRRQRLMPAGDLSRRRFVERLFATDSRMLVDSSWATPVVETDQFSELAQVYSQLPAVQFVDVPAVDSDSQSEIPSRSLPVMVRQVSTKDGAWFYAVNSSPWPIKVRGQLGKPDADESSGSRPTESYQPILGSRLNSARWEPFSEGEQQLVAFEIPAWSLIAGRSSDANARLQAYSVGFPADADLQLKKHIYRLQSLLVRSTEAQPLNGLTNPSFEAEATKVADGEEQNDAAAKSTLSGWTSGPSDVLGDDAVTSRKGTNVRFETTDVHEGARAIRLTNEDDAPIWIRSNEFSAPETGRLSVSAWLKTNQPNRPLPFRISLEGVSGTTTYYRFGEIGSQVANEGGSQAGAKWQRFAVHFDDLPLENLDRLRVGFDLMGPGSVMIDRVEIFDRWFDENDSKAITQLLATASTLLSTPATYDRCRRLLESYWPRFLTEHFEEPSGQLAKNDQRSDPLGDEVDGSRSKIRARAVSWPIRKPASDATEESGQPVKQPKLEPELKPEPSNHLGSPPVFPPTTTRGNRKFRFRNVFAPRTPGSR